MEAQVPALYDKHFPHFPLVKQDGKWGFCLHMNMTEAIQEYGFDCKIRKLSPKTIVNYQKQLKYLQRYLEVEFEVTEIEEVKSLHIKHFLAMMDDRGRKARYINDLLKVFKTFFSYLRKEGYLKERPTANIKNMKQPKVKILTFSNAEIRRMLNYYDGRNFLDIRNRTMIALFFDTGMRLNEVISLEASQIHDDYILVHGKGAKERVVPVSPYLAKTMLHYQAVRERFFEGAKLPEKYFFVSRTGKKLTPEAITKFLKRAAQEVRVNDQIRVSPHTFRHTFAHMQLKNGLDLYTLSRVMGHESVAITQRYLEGIQDKEVIEASMRTGVLANL